MFTLDKMISEIDLCCKSASSEVVAVCDEPKIRMLDAASFRMTEHHRFMALLAYFTISRLASPYLVRFLFQCAPYQAPVCL